MLFFLPITMSSTPLSDSSAIVPTIVLYNYNRVYIKIPRYYSTIHTWYSTGTILRVQYTRDIPRYYSTIHPWQSISYTEYSVSTRFAVALLLKLLSEFHIQKYFPVVYKGLAIKLTAMFLLSFYSSSCSQNVLFCENYSKWRYLYCFCPDFAFTNTLPMYSVICSSSSWIDYRAR